MTAKLFSAPSNPATVGLPTLHTGVTDADRLAATINGKTVRRGDFYEAATGNRYVLVGNDPTEEADWQLQTLLSGDVEVGANLHAPNQSADWATLASNQCPTKEAINNAANFVLPLLQINDNTATASGAGRAITPYRVNTFSFGYGAFVPGDMTRFRVTLYIGWTTNPSADLFPVYVRFNKPNTNSTSTYETLHGSRFGATVYPDDTTGIPGTLTDLGAAGGYANTFKFVSDWIAIPAGWQSNAAAFGAYELFGVWLGNNSGGSLTDGYNFNHGIRGMMEFKR